mmetsp:Transcript_7243/g.17561  ORF Transcript_7243/g.17561 Transcript_7243/m.17561 type:complete len:283 (+) Transcript_7243:116-964(+)
MESTATVIPASLSARPPDATTKTGVDPAATAKNAIQPYDEATGIHSYECFSHFQKTGRFGVLDPITTRTVSPWEPFVAAILDSNDRDIKLVGGGQNINISAGAVASSNSKDNSGDAAHGSDSTTGGKQMTANEYWRQKKYDENMFKFEDDSYNFAKQRYKLELQRLNRGHDSMDGGALWLGRVLICDDEIWLALWGKSMKRFEVVLDTCRQRSVFCDTRMEYRPPVILPRPYMQLQLNHRERPLVLKELLTFSLNGLPIHVVDLREGGGGGAAGGGGGEMKK